jgi:hypothetical protein
MRYLVIILILLLAACKTAPDQHHHSHYNFTISGGSPEVYVGVLPDSLIISGGGPRLIFGDTVIQLGPGGWKFQQIHDSDTMIITPYGQTIR